jgi:hypothetical protein
MRRHLSLFGLMAALSAIVAISIAASSAGARTASGSQIPLSGTGAPQTGFFVGSESGLGDVEFLGEGDDEAGSPESFDGMIVDRSLSKGSGAGLVTTNAKKAKSNPQFVTGFEGLNHFQQRYARGGNQFSLEPPDQGLCVGNGYVVEVVNDVINVYNEAGQSVLPDNTATNIVSGFPTDVNHTVDLNSFYGYPPAVNRSIPNGQPNHFGQFVTDPSCLYDAQTQRFFAVVLTLEVNSTTGGFTTANHLDIAVSQTSSPVGTWNIYRLPVTNDGTNTGGVNPGPYLGDYPHIGADANGFYVTTNAYPWCCNGFSGAQIYALSKAQLAAGAASVAVQHLDTSGLVDVPSDAGSTQPGFTVWPAQSPGTGSFDLNAGGTEYFMSSNAADEATHPVAGTGGNYTSEQIVVWALTNTSSLNSATPDLHLSNTVLPVGLYAIPPRQHQPGTGLPPTLATPQGYCLNDETTPTIAGVGCWRLLVSETAHNATKPEVTTAIDSNDTRMQQVDYANGKLWGALDTAINPGGGGQRAGIAYYIVKPDASSGTVSAKVALTGYLGAAGADLTYPAIGVTPSGRGVMAFTYTSDTTFPSAAYAPIDALAGAGAWSFAGPGGQGAATDDGFSGYKAQRFPNPIRPRWGDYGAAAVDGNSIWIASEYIAHACDYATWGGRFFGATTGDNKLGTCAPSPGAAGPRTALANWSTHISKLVP